MNSKPIKVPGPAHTFTITPMKGWVVFTVNSKCVGDTGEALTLKEAGDPAQCNSFPAGMSIRRNCNGALQGRLEVGVDGSGKELVAEHWQPALRLTPSRLVLQHIPVFGKNPVGDAQDVRPDSVHWVVFTPRSGRGSSCSRPRR
jgi:hypothetical protein